MNDRLAGKQRIPVSLHGDEEIMKTAPETFSNGAFPGCFAGNILNALRFSH
jgi:hypothetical protein